MTRRRTVSGGGLPRKRSIRNAGDLRREQPSKVAGTRARGRDVPHGRVDPDVGDRRERGRDGHHQSTAASRSAPPRPPAIGILTRDIGDVELPEAVFGQYPKLLLRDLLPLLRCERREILHVCSGSLPPGEGIRVDMRTAARPDILADGRRLPIATGSVKAVLLDPPYTSDYARDLYGVDYPIPSHLLAEAARVVRPCGRIGFVHFLVPHPPPGCRFIKVLGLSTGCGYAMRAVSIFEKEQDSLPGVT